MSLKAIIPAGATDAVNLRIFDGEGVQTGLFPNTTYEVYEMVLRETVATMPEESLTLRQQIEALRDEDHENSGIRPDTVLRVPSAANIPAGCTWLASPPTVRVPEAYTPTNGFGPIERWDFRGIYVEVRGFVQAIRDCHFGAQGSANPGQSYPLDIYGEVGEVAYNDFTGPGSFFISTNYTAAINQRVAGSGESTIVAEVPYIHHNRFTRFPSDYLKLKGSTSYFRQRVEWNFFGAPVNLPNDPPLWTGVGVYALGYAVRRADGWVYLSKVAGNTGNALPTDAQNKEAENDFWLGIDPHSDAITIAAAVANGVVVRRNLIEHSRNPASGPVLNIGLTNYVRIEPTNPQTPMRYISVEENVMLRQPNEVASYPLQVDARGASLATMFTGPVRFVNNWITRPTNFTRVTHPTSDGLVDLWENNLAAQDDAPLAGPAPRNPDRPAFVTAIVGQSENVVGFANNTTYYTGGPYPALLSGVNAEYANLKINDRASGTEPQIRSVTAANITARVIPPGMVALANLWHQGSQGRPLRIVANVFSGTDLDKMLTDNATDDRDLSKEKELVALAQAQWNAPVSRVMFNWWNAEAGNSKDLWNRRSMHILGINPDGSPWDFSQVPATSSLSPPIPIQGCLIDTTGRGYGIFPATAKLDFTYPGLAVFRNSGAGVQPLDPMAQPMPGYNVLTGVNPGDPNRWADGMPRQNAAPAFEARRDFLSRTPSANRGVATIAPNLARFGDYTGGVQNSGSAQTLIHPAMQHKDGQILFSQDIAAAFLIAEGHAQATTIFDMVRVSSTVFDLRFMLPVGGQLVTQRLREGIPATALRPQQQQVMGFVIARGSDSELTRRPLYRVDSALNDTLYPTAYRGTATIQDTGAATGVGIVRITMQEPLANGDVIHFMQEGTAGSWILHGHPDYDAHLYKDGLRVYEARLDDGSATRYPGIPVVGQWSRTVTTTAPPTGFTTTTDPANGRITITAAPNVAKPVAGSTTPGTINVTG